MKEMQGLARLDISEMGRTRMFWVSGKLQWSRDFPHCFFNEVTSTHCWALTTLVQNRTLSPTLLLCLSPSWILNERDKKPYSSPARHTKQKGAFCSNTVRRALLSLHWAFILFFTCHHLGREGHAEDELRSKPVQDFGSVSQVHISFNGPSSDPEFLAVLVVLSVYLQYP